MFLVFPVADNVYNNKKLMGKLCEQWVKAEAASKKKEEEQLEN
jgi:hypothetical protein